MSKAEKATAEKVKEIERLLMRIDTLEGANERFMQAKEHQDNEMAMLHQRNRELVSQVLELYPFYILINLFLYVTLLSLGGFNGMG